MGFTKEQVNKWNEKCGNGFKTDIRSLMMHGEKVLSKHYDLGEGKLLKAEICYTAEYEVKENASGQKFNHPTFKHEPTLWLSVWHDEGGSMMHSYGLGYQKKIGETQDKKLFSYLQKISHTVSHEMVMDFYKESEKSALDKARKEIAENTGILGGRI